MALYEVNANELVSRVAQELKKESIVKPADWAPFAKTGISRERAPVQADWWYVRSASILRKVALLGPIGTSKLQRKYGGRKNMGMAPDRFFPAAGNHIRKILQQLEKAGFTKQGVKGAHKGRILTPKGMQFIERVAAEILKEQGVKLPPKPAATQTVESTETKEEAPKAPKKPRAPKKKKEETAPEAAAAPAPSQ